MGSPAVFLIAGICIVSIAQIGCSMRNAATRGSAEIRLQYDAKLVGLGFPSPLLRGNIRGHQVWFVIDTGASVHTLASWFVTEAGVPARQTKATTKGSTGAESTIR